MKTNTIIIWWLGLFVLFQFPLKANSPADSSIIKIKRQIKNELISHKAAYDMKLNEIAVRLQAINGNLTVSQIKIDVEKYVNLLGEKIELQEEMLLLEDQYQLGLAKTRYKKGMEIIKMMYEKILGLDHHFHSLKTYQNVMQMSNPHTYPEFQETKSIIENRLRKKHAVQLPNLLNSNPYLSATYSLVAAFVGDGEPKNKEADLEKIACILDFTVRMNTDLNLIFYETEFLKESNNALNQECIQLFRDYSKVIGYKVALDICRSEDDWETVYEMLEIHIEKMENQSKNTNSNPIARKKLLKSISDLEFSLDRLLGFLDKYSTFISQGEKYYQKFYVIVSNYQNETACEGKLPHQFNTLKEDINYSIEKFNEAYNIAELKGSKLKDLLYGM